MKKGLVLALLLTFLLAGSVLAEEVVLFNFEDGLQGWEIPEWAFEKPDMVLKEIDVTDEFASNGSKSMIMDADFTGGRWTGALVEIMQYYDWTDYSSLAVDIYLPKDAPMGLRAKMILTIGDSWKWVEMSKTYALNPGKWTTITADLKPGSIDWRRIQVDDAFRADVRKIDVRIESNNRPAYTGKIYVDNIRVIE